MPQRTQILHNVLFSILFLSVLFSCKKKERKFLQNLKSTTKLVQQTVEKNKTSLKTIASKITVDFITGHFDPSTDSTFIQVSDKYADRHGMYMKKQAYDAFLKMWTAAKKDGINLEIRSAARNFDYQKGIWERKWTGETKLSTGENASKAYTKPEERALKILEYSSMPGTSRHHWGTDVDFNNFNNDWFEKGEGLKLFTWLENNASDFGFCRPYTQKDNKRPYGYNEEKWHWSYMPLSRAYTEFAQKELNNQNIKGFKGSDVASAIDVVNKYVLGINHSCK